MSTATLQNRMRTRYARKLISSALGLIVLGCLWFYFAPVPFGGSATYVVTHGISMEPRFHTGDLAIVRSQSSYHVGEIVAYDNKMLHTVVLHRIVGHSGGHYTFKGDNNNYVDFEHPAANQLIGALWIHVPGAGATLKSIRSPALVGALVAAGMLLFTGAAFTRRRRLRRRQRRAGNISAPGPMPMPRPTEPVVTVLAIGLVALLPFVALAVLAFTRPATKLHTVQVPYKQSGRFSYSANAAPGPAYSGDRAVTGDPLFTRVLSDVNVHFGYLFASAAKHSLTGRASLSATLASTSGWRTTFPLGSPTSFHGDRAVAAATLNLTSLLSLIHSVQNTTKVSGTYTLTLTPYVSATGNLDRLPLNTTFSPQLQFSLNELEAQPVLGAAGTAAGGRSLANLFTPSAAGSVPARRYQPLFVSIKIARLSVATARSIALIAIAIIACALVAVLALARPRRRPRDASASIRARYGHLIIPVAHVAQAPGISVIDVADMDALVRIAEHYDRSILHETGTDGEAFWVSDESGQFRYAVGGSTYVAAPQGPLAGVASDVYADELELGGAIAAFEMQTPAQPWAAFDLADAITEETRPGRRSTDMAADGSPTRAGAFARVAGLN